MIIAAKTDRRTTLNVARPVATALLFVTSIALSLLLAEGILRLVFDPVDYLMPQLKTDAILRHVVEPNSGGHDAWGFRNKSVPSHADIVAIGDSLTYGVSAAAVNSWPAALERLKHKSVYNLGLGGLGPVDYQYLLETKAVLLKPSAVVVGFYFGNDLTDAFNLVYRRDYWKDLRNSGFQPEADWPANRFAPDTTIFMGGLRFYLAHHSVLYRSAMLSFGESLRFLEMKYAGVEDTVILDDPKLGIRTGFTPATTLLTLKLDEPRVKEGFRISMKSLLTMSRFCEERGIRFYVLLLPTKESVFAKYIDGNGSQLKNQAAFHDVILNEQTAAELLKKCLDENRITYINVLEPLRDAVGRRTIYPANSDAHPNKAGYEIIAKRVSTELKP